MVRSTRSRAAFFFFLGRDKSWRIGGFHQQLWRKKCSGAAQKAEHRQTPARKVLMHSMYEMFCGLSPWDPVSAELNGKLLGKTHDIRALGPGQYSFSLTARVLGVGRILFSTLQTRRKTFPAITVPCALWLLSASDPASDPFSVMSLKIDWRLSRSKHGSWAFFKRKKKCILLCLCARVRWVAAAGGHEPPTMDAGKWVCVFHQSSQLLRHPFNPKGHDFHLAHQCGACSSAPFMPVSAQPQFPLKSRLPGRVPRDEAWLPLVSSTVLRSLLGPCRSPENVFHSDNRPTASKKNLLHVLTVKVSKCAVD